MPYAFDVVTSTARDHAVRSIKRVFESAARQADRLGDEALHEAAGRRFSLQELPQAEVDAFVRDFRTRVVWTDEGMCFDRAIYGAQLLGARTGVGRTPLDDTFAAGIAVSQHEHPGGGYTGAFHASMVVRIKHRPELVAIDLLPGQRPLPSLHAWSVNPTPMLLRPFAGTGIGTRASYVNREGFENSARRLASRWSDEGTRIDIRR